MRNRLSPKEAMRELEGLAWDVFIAGVWGAIAFFVFFAFVGLR